MEFAPIATPFRFNECILVTPILAVATDQIPKSEHAFLLLYEGRLLPRFALRGAMPTARGNILKHCKFDVGCEVYLIVKTWHLPIAAVRRKITTVNRADLIRQHLPIVPAAGYGNWKMATESLPIRPNSPKYKR
jgi:hypothetical protein